MNKMKVDRLERTFEILASVNPYLAKEMFASKRLENMSPKSRAAIRIQKVYRGYSSRKIYAKILFAYYEKLEQEEIAERNRQVEEGLRQIQAQDFENKISEREFNERQRKIRRNSAAITIQRKFRKHLKNPKRIINMKKPVKQDKYQKYREIINTPVKIDPEEPDLNSEFEMKIAKAAGVNIRKSKTLAKEKVEQEEQKENEYKKNEMSILRKRYMELVKLVEQKSKRLQEILEERADLMAELEE